MAFANNWEEGAPMTEVWKTLKPTVCKALGVKEYLLNKKEENEYMTVIRLVLFHPLPCPSPSCLRHIPFIAAWRKTEPCLNVEAQDMWRS